MLSLCRPLAYFLQVCCLEKNLMEKECRCFLAWISLLEYCHSIHQLDQPIAKHMEDLVQTALACLVECGWVQYMRPKMHWRLHFPGVVPRFGILPSCWTCERKHKVVRKYGSNCFNVQHYDTSVLRRPWGSKPVLCLHLKNFGLLGWSNLASQARGCNSFWHSSTFGLGIHNVCPMVWWLLLEMLYFSHWIQPQASTSDVAVCITFFKLVRFWWHWLKSTSLWSVHSTGMLPHGSLGLGLCLLCVQMQLTVLWCTVWQIVDLSHACIQHIFVPKAIDVASLCVQKGIPESQV